jgi:hypothetical protein
MKNHELPPWFPEKNLSCGSVLLVDLEPAFTHLHLEFCQFQVLSFND